MRERARRACGQLLPSDIDTPLPPQSAFRGDTFAKQQLKLRRRRKCSIHSGPVIISDTSGKQTDGEEGNDDVIDAYLHLAVFLILAPPIRLWRRAEQSSAGKLEKGCGDVT